ncbi:hypothetical protein D3C87_1918850 [compost metagenome]
MLGPRSAETDAAPLVSKPPSTKEMLEVPVPLKILSTRVTASVWMVGRSSMSTGMSTAQGLLTTWEPAS